MTRTEILDAAKSIVTGEREKQYGGAENSFSTIANLWMDYWVAKGHEVPIGPTDVAVMMALLKIARIAGGRFKEDSYIDACGYMACAGEIEGAE